MYLLISSLVGYLFGCLNGSQLIGKYKQVSIKHAGMKNAGATNATLVLGVKYGVVVASTARSASQRMAPFLSPTSGR